VNISSLEDLREEVQAIDNEIEVLLYDRFVLTNNIGRLKKKLGLPIENLQVENNKLASMPDELKLIFKEIFKVSKQCQNTIV
jgi:chorismate mutase